METRTRFERAQLELAHLHAEMAQLQREAGLYPPEPPRQADLFDHELARTAPAPRREPPPLTAADWPTCADPNRLLARVAGTVSERKLRLVTVAAARLAWDAVTPEMREAVETAERLADGLATAEELQWYRDRLYPYVSGRGPAAVRRWATPGPDRDAFCLVFAATYRAEMVRRLHGGGVWQVGSAAHADEVAPLVRCIVGDPFRAATFDPAWLTADVRGLAVAAYEDRAFDRLPILADALADAGCDDEAVLAHCRENGPHVRGCWVVDLVLGRE
jgi:hypothetical protein